MSLSEIASMLFGALGVGGGMVALYIRGTIAETIVTRLNGRYVGSSVCMERHVNLAAHLERMERQAERIDQKVEEGFEALRDQLVMVQKNGIRIEHDQIKREKAVFDRLKESED